MKFDFVSDFTLKFGGLSVKVFIDAIENACKDVKYSELLYKYKRDLLDEMNDRACDVQQAGLTDEKVISDLILSEYPDIRGDFDRFFALEKRKRKESLEHKLLAIGTPLFIILAVAVYVIQGIMFDTWSGNWLIIVGTAFVMCILCALAANRKILRLKKVFHPIARLLTAGCVMLVAVFVFLLCGVTIGWGSTWVIIPGGVIALLLGDLAFAFITRQKFVMINTFIYIPAVFTLLYVILAGVGIVTWGKGWALILLGVALDAVIGLCVLLNNAKYKYKQEVEDIWNEN